MFTIFDMIAVLMPLTAALLGARVGSEWGWTQAIGGGVAGLLVGYVLGQLPIRWVVWRVRKQLAPFTTEQLRAALTDPKCFTPNFLLMELRLRGEDISQHVGLVLHLMADDAYVRRTRGYAAWLSAYPQWAKRLAGYNPGHSVAECRAKVEALRREIAAQSPAT